MISRIKGLVRFSTAQALTRFVSDLDASVLAHEVWVDRRDIPPVLRPAGTNAIYLDIAFKEERFTEALWTDLQARSIARCFVTNHQCAIDDPTVRDRPNPFRKFEVL